MLLLFLSNNVYPFSHFLLGQPLASCLAGCTGIRGSYMNGMGFLVLLIADWMRLMPSGVFKPYVGVPTGIMVFTKGQPTKKDWFYDMEGDGFSLDDKRTFTDGKGDMLHYSSNHVATSVKSTL